MILFKYIIFHINGKQLWLWQIFLIFTVINYNLVQLFTLDIDFFSMGLCSYLCGQDKILLTCYNCYDIYIFVLCCILLYVYCTGYFLYFYSLNHRIPWNSVRLRTKSFHHNTIKLFLSISYFNLSTPPEYKQCYNCKGAYILEWIWSVLRPKKINEQVLRPKFSKYNATDRSFIFIFIARFPKYYIWYWKLK